MTERINEPEYKRPKFTREQEDWLYGELGEWWLSWRNRITNESSQHSLVQAASEIKGILSGTKTKCVQGKAEEDKAFVAGFREMRSQSAVLTRRIKIFNWIITALGVTLFLQIFLNLRLPIIEYFTN